jgi:hypothetical protein
VDIGSVFGIEVRGQMSRRTVQRIVLEKGVAADMQIVYEIWNPVVSVCPKRQVLNLIWQLDRDNLQFWFYITQAYSNKPSKDSEIELLYS